MMDLALSVLALIAGGVTLELFAAGLPPLDVQNEGSSRLHAQAREAQEATQIENPS